MSKAGKKEHGVGEEESKMERALETTDNSLNRYLSLKVKSSHKRNGLAYAICQK